jgi:hypothetical protein
VSIDIINEAQAADVRDRVRSDLMKQLLTFAETHIRGAALDRDDRRAVAGLIELRRIYVGLSHVYPEFEQQVEEMDRGFDRLIEAGRGRLLRWYVRTRDPDEVRELGEILEQIIARGGWDDWQAEFELALAERSPPQVAS